MNAEPLELLSAFVDGEEVDPAALAAALAAPGARDVLRDFVLLRTEVRDDDSAPSPEAYRRTRASLEPAGPATWWRRMIPVPAPALAAVVIVALAVAVWAGVAFRRPVADALDAPPVPDRVLQLDPVEVWNETEG